MVVDSSVIIAIARSEPDSARLEERIDRDDAPNISVASVLECSIVLRSFKDIPNELAETQLDALLFDSGFTIQPVTLDQLRDARLAHSRYGKGTGHPAQLNFGDCFSYALAKSLNVPLLYKGTDVGKTDIVSALRSSL